VCCSVLQCVAVCEQMRETQTLSRFVRYDSVMHRVVCCSVLCVAVVTRETQVGTIETQAQAQTHTHTHT